jgi:MoaA/NifB/PqqE/SkfB family radical SAM enzyme
MPSLKEYLSDPFLYHLYSEVRNAGPIRSVSLDITQHCNLRCTGCYYFHEEMDQCSTTDESLLDQWILSEKERGTNFVTVVGGEPSLALPRLKKIYDNFKSNVATNGLIRIPMEGFENLPIGVALWGNHQADAQLRINGKQNLFARAKANYKNDSRAFWYYTVAPGNADQIEQVVEECIQNGNKVLFNYYSDLSGAGGDLDYRQGFERVMEGIDRVIERYPSMIYNSSYLNRVITTGTLYEEKWGYDSCTNISTNYEGNQARMKTNKPFNKHFRAYHADFTSTRRCCTGTKRSCDSCFDTWEHFSWIMINLRKHLGSKEEFSHWLFAMYSFYLINRLVDITQEEGMLSEMHAAAEVGMKT